MTALTHQWNHRYTTPIRGQALKAARPGYHIALAIGEIQDTITAIKAANDETPHQWVARFPIPHNLQTISRNRPGTYISLSLGEIQSVVDGMTGISQGDKLPTSLFASYSEHRQVLGQSGYTPDEEIVEPAAYQWTHRYPKPSTGEVIHIARPGLNIAQVITEIQNRLSALPPSDDSSSAIEEMQTWLETNCTSFIDSTSGPLNPAEDGFLYYTLATWRTAAGIEDRPLNIDELQRGFGALKILPVIGRIEGIRTIFPSVTGAASIYGEKGTVYYPWYSNPLGAAGTYSIVMTSDGGNEDPLDYNGFACGREKRVGLYDLLAASFGFCRAPNSPNSGSLTFLDSFMKFANSYYVIDGPGGALTVTITEAKIDISQAGPGYWYLGFFPYIEVPFTQA